MNVYSCWHRDNFGYACRTLSGRWMFVPEMGQRDTRVHRELRLEELVFQQGSDHALEMLRQQQSGIISFLKSLVFPAPRPQTIAGLLFTCQ